MQALFRYTLNNVIFGIALMVVIGLYIAIGSGVPAVRERFELDTLGFFNAWPLKTLMLLLCANLATVTWNRIPLTPARYGVWCIHAGILTLIIGTSLYYHLKVEGKVMIPINHVSNIFYDSSERALYARALNKPIFGMSPLPSLPRFGTYEPGMSPAPLPGRDLANISRMTPLGNAGDQPDELSAWLGVKDPVRLDVVGYYPYAEVVEDTVQDPTSNDVGVEMVVQNSHADSPGTPLTFTTADPTTAHQLIGQTELAHRNIPESSLKDTIDQAHRLFRISYTRPGKSMTTIDGEPGKTYDLGGGYQATVDSYNPAFPMFGTHEIVRALTLHIVSDAPAAKREFWRMILEGRSLQTDFRMDPATTPPFVKGNRQKTPIDNDLVLIFTATDPAALLPEQGQVKHTLITAGDSDLIDIATSLTAPTTVTDLRNGGKISVALDGATATADVRRVNHIRVLSHVVPTPPARQNKDEGESGVKQVAVVRVSCGDFSQVVNVPCDLYAGPDLMSMEPVQPWMMGVVRIPGASSLLQLQLGFTAKPMPAALVLKRFEMIHYPGGSGDTGPFRDFRSTLEMTDINGETTTAVASLNEPIYFDGGRWIFFQAGYDPDGQASTIGVGNRPGVGLMLTGCVMMAIGLFYAFYIKPIVIRRMKAKALARAANQRRRDPQVAAV